MDWYNQTSIKAYRKYVHRFGDRSAAVFIIGGLAAIVTGIVKDNSNLTIGGSASTFLGGTLYTVNHYRAGICMLADAMKKSKKVKL